MKLWRFFNHLHTVPYIYLWYCCLFVSMPQLKAWGSPKAGWEGSLQNCSPHLYTLSYAPVQCYPPLTVRQLHSSFRDFSNGVCHITKITLAGSHLDMELITQQTFGVSPVNLLARDKKMWIMAMAVAFGGANGTTNDVFNFSFRCSSQELKRMKDLKDTKMYRFCFSVGIIKDIFTTPNRFLIFLQLSFH